MNETTEPMTVRQLIEALVAVERPDLPVFIVDDREAYDARSFSILLMEEGDEPYIVLER